MRRTHGWHLLATSLLISAACGSDTTAGTATAPSLPTAGSPAVSPPASVATTAPVAATPGAATSAPATATTGTAAPVAGTSAAPVTTAAPTAAVAPVVGDVPCAVSKILAAACQKCHGATTAFGAPMSLVTAADFQKLGISEKIPLHALAIKRITGVSTPLMPPGGLLSMDEKKVLTDWLGAGAPPAASETKCAVEAIDGARTLSTVPHDEAYYKNGLTPQPGETCWELKTHGGQTADDTTKFDIRAGEFYEQFYFKVPWTADDVMTRYGAKYDNLKVLHHWLLFTSSKPASQIGTHEGTSGSTIGDTSQLIAGWAVGGDHVEFPPDTGLELVQTGILNVQWHYYNQTGAPAPDATAVQVCTVKRSARKNIGSLTFLGTENFNGPLGMPAKTKSDFTTSCPNSSGAPITIFGFTPHMHKLGINMRADVMRANGTMEKVFDKPFDFNSQVTYLLNTPLVLAPGDAVVSTCTFNNTTNAGVPFGPSSDQEMCYNFTMSYPAKALDNGTPSLIGATNTCW